MSTTSTILLRCRRFPSSALAAVSSSFVEKIRMYQSTTATVATSSSKGIKRLGTLRVVGPDCVGLLAACTQVLNYHRCNIVKSEQWTDTRQNVFFQRIIYQYNGEEHHDGGNNNNDNNKIAVDKIACEQDLIDLFPKPLLMKTLWDWRDRRKKIGILVSKYDHCLWELLLRHEARELDADISVVISNHETLRPVAEIFGIPYHFTPILKTTTTTKMNTQEDNNNNKSLLLPHHEVQQLQLLKDVDVVILARYMQVLSSEFLKQFPADGIVNIHHSFLPAFVGRSPYRQAHDRGVKLIGATAHYTTEVLDDGPIIEQDVVDCSHRDSVQQLVKKGRVLERNVLLKAIEAHIDGRIIVHGNRCVVFGD